MSALHCTNCVSNHARTLPSDHWKVPSPATQARWAGAGVFVAALILIVLSI